MSSAEALCSKVVDKAIFSKALHTSADRLFVLVHVTQDDVKAVPLPEEKHKWRLERNLLLREIDVLSVDVSIRSPISGTNRGLIYLKNIFVDLIRSI